MPKVTNLTAPELATLNTTLESLLHKGLAAFKDAATNKGEQTVYNLVEIGVNMAEHLSVERKLGTLIDGTNRLLPKLTKYFNTDTVLGLIPQELKTLENTALLEKAGALPLAKLLRAVESASGAASPVSAQVLKL